MACTRQNIKVPNSERPVDFQGSRGVKETVAHKDNDFWGFDSTLPVFPSSPTQTGDVVKLTSQGLASLKQAGEEHN